MSLNYRIEDIERAFFGESSGSEPESEESGDFGPLANDYGVIKICGPEKPKQKHIPKYPRHEVKTIPNKAPSVAFQPIPPWKLKKVEENRPENIFERSDEPPPRLLKIKKKKLPRVFVESPQPTTNPKKQEEEDTKLMQEHEELEKKKKLFKILKARLEQKEQEKQKQKTQTQEKHKNRGTKYEIAKIPENIPQVFKREMKDIQKREKVQEEVYNPPRREYNIDPRRPTRASTLKTRCSRQEIERRENEKIREEINEQIREQRANEIKETMRNTLIRLKLEEKDSSKFEKERKMMKINERKWSNWLALTNQANKQRQSLLERVADEYDNQSGFRSEDQ